MTFRSSRTVGVATEHELRKVGTCEKRCGQGFCPHGKSIGSRAIAAAGTFPPQCADARAAAIYPVNRTAERISKLATRKLSEDDNLAFTMRTNQQAVLRKRFGFQARLYLYGLVIAGDELLPKTAQ